MEDWTKEEIERDRQKFCDEVNKEREESLRKFYKHLFKCSNCHKLYGSDNYDEARKLCPYCVCKLIRSKRSSFTPMK